MLIWDTAGQERFNTITPTFYKQSKGALIIFDLTERESFVKVNKWLESLDMHSDIEIIKYLIGNKVDKEEEREVTKEEGDEMAQKYDMKYCECSAYTGAGVTQAIDSLVVDIFEKCGPGIVKLLSFFV